VPHGWHRTRHFGGDPRRHLARQRVGVAARHVVDAASDQAPFLIGKNRLFEFVWRATGDERQEE